LLKSFSKKRAEHFIEAHRCFFTVLQISTCKLDAAQLLATIGSVWVNSAIGGIFN